MGVDRQTDSVSTYERSSAALLREWNRTFLLDVMESIYETDEDGSWCSKMGGIYTKNEALALAWDV